jgi:hypothetical protein
MSTHPNQERRPAVNSSNYNQQVRSGPKSTSNMTGNSNRRANKNVVSEKSKTKRKIRNKKTKESDTKTKESDTRRDTGKQ